MTDHHDRASTFEPNLLREGSSRCHLRRALLSLALFAFAAGACSDDDPPSDAESSGNNTGASDATGSDGCQLTASGDLQFSAPCVAILNEPREESTLRSVSIQTLVEDDGYFDFRLGGVPEPYLGTFTPQDAIDNDVVASSQVAIDPARGESWWISTNYDNTPSVGDYVLTIGNIDEYGPGSRPGSRRMKQGGLEATLGSKTGGDGMVTVIVTY